jgi:hypothetical protein|nr:hypothetical protein [Kofleriaceae bacterium]
MRRALLLCLVASVAHADPGDSDWPKDVQLKIHDGDVPDDPPMAEFASPTTFTLMRLGDDGAPRCEAWTTKADGGDPNHGELVHDKLSVPWHDAGIRLDVCDTHALVREDGAGAAYELDVDGAKWFKDARTCQAAIAKKRAVATDFSSCLDQAGPAQKAIDATRARFVAVLQKGGALTVRDGDACRAAKVVLDHGTQTPSGTLTIEYPDRVRSLHYDFDNDPNAGKLDVTEDHTDSRGSDATGRYGCVCADEYELHVGDGKVDTLDETLYLDANACRTAAAVAVRRRSWLPTSN